MNCFCCAFMESLDLTFAKISNYLAIDYLIVLQFHIIKKIYKKNTYSFATDATL
jgi:hypothetical protein